jgi:hypothetical protein
MDSIGQPHEVSSEACVGREFVVGPFPDLMAFYIRPLSRFFVVPLICTLKNKWFRAKDTKRHIFQFFIPG